jgi:hypothetical protein
MIDEPRKTQLLMAGLKESLPIPAIIPPQLARKLAEGKPQSSIPSRCNVIDVIYSGDVGGVLCNLDVDGREAKEVHLVSITQLSFSRNVSLFREIEAYQRHRIKKLKKQQGFGYRNPLS